MKKSKFTTEQIVLALRQAEAGLGVDETCRKLGIGQATSFRWRSKPYWTSPGARGGDLNTGSVPARQRPRAS